MKMDKQNVEEVAYVLIVDDHDLRRQWMKHALAGGPFRVRTTTCGRRGLRHLRQVRFDVVVVGEHLRGMGVKDFISNVHRHYPSIPTVVVPCAMFSQRDPIAGSPGTYHWLVLSTVEQQHALRRMVEQAIAHAEPACDKQGGARIAWLME